MAALQLRGGVYRLLFQYNGKQHTYTVGDVPVAEARHWKARTEQLLMRVKQGVLDVPRGVSIADFIRYDGKPPVDAAVAAAKDTTFLQLRTAFLAAVGNGAIEANTLSTTKIHLTHVETTLGKKFILAGLTLGKLQEHLNRRAKDVAPVTVKKEIDTFRAAWNWGLRMKWVDQAFPSSGLLYPKTDEKLPFMTWDEIERRLRSGGDPDQLWECLYLDTERLAELLAHVSAKKAPAWLYPMVVTAAHTGARRSELIRMRVEDVDLAGGFITIREKKRARGVRTSRRVPISKLTADVLTPLIQRQADVPFLFGTGVAMLSVQATHKALWRALQKSEWAVVKGWHTLRHGFISACASKAVDQRVLDGWVGHQTEEQRVRYRHLYPSLQQAALKTVFG